MFEYSIVMAKTAEEKERENNRRSSNLYNARKAGFDSILEHQMDMIKRRFEKKNIDIENVSVADVEV